MTDAIAPLSALIAEEPEKAPVPYYFATQEGWYTNLPTFYGTAHVPAGKWPKNLPVVEKTFTQNDQRIPGFIFDQALDFFRRVYEKHQTEATTYICRDDTGQYSLFIPKQYVTGASVAHKVEPGEMRGRQAMGTIHSHCMMSAFHSGTDAHDMGKMPGVHATIGMVMSNEPEYAVAFAVGDTRFDIQPEDIIDESITGDINGFNTAPDRWLSFVHPNERAPWTGGVTTVYGPKYKKPTNRYQYGQMKSLPDHWSDYGWDYYSQYRPTKTHDTEDDLQDALELSKHFLFEEAIELANMGYRLTYDIEYDEEKAKDFLEEQQPSASMVPMFGMEEMK